MEKYQTIHTEFNETLVTLWLSRPEVHNALNSGMIAEIRHFFTLLEGMPQIRMVVIRGEGTSFCSGADLREMKDSLSLDPAENLKESKELFNLFSTIFNSSKVVIAVVHGNIFGGGNGLIAAADLAFGTIDTRFALSETKVGMAAFSISPYLMLKIKSSVLKELIFTARTFTAEEAVENGLLNQSFGTMEELELHLTGLIANLMRNGILAISASKRLINNLAIQGWSKQLEQIPELLANIRVSPEAQEGMTAFLEKRRPNWE